MKFIYLFVFINEKRSIVVVLLIYFVYSVSESSDKLPTSLVYLDTFINPNKLLGHLQIYKADEKNAVQFHHGKHYFL